jgi:hypothetical protein
MKIYFYLVICVILTIVQCENPFSSEDIYAPKNFSISQSWDGILLTWNDNNKYEDGYDIFRNNQKIATLNSDIVEYLDYSFSPFEPLAYYVSCFKDGGESKDTDIKNISIALKFYDRFSNDIASYWYKVPDSNVLTLINGQMNIDGNDNDGYQHNAYFYKDVNTPFTFGANSKKISGSSNEPFGIGIRSESTGAKVFIFISTDGRISVDEYNNDWRFLMSPISTDYLNSIGYNEIRICVDSNELKVYINNHEVCLLNYLFSDLADCFYLYTQGDLSVNFDDIYLFEN